MTQIVLSNRRRVKRSTKVPADGGFYQGERLTAAQAKKRAMLVAVDLANVEQKEAQREEDAEWVFPRLRVHSNPSQEFTQLVRLHGIGVTGSETGGGRRRRCCDSFCGLGSNMMNHPVGRFPAGCQDCAALCRLAAVLSANLPEG